MIDPKKAGYFYLTFISSQVQTSYNFVITEVRAGNYRKLARVYVASRRLHESKVRR